MPNETRSEPRRLGATGPTVFPIALGCMGMSGMYGPSDERESIATIHAAIDQGINLLDTGDFHGMGHNENAELPPTAVAGTRYDEHQMRMLDSER